MSVAMVKISSWFAIRKIINLDSYFEIGVIRAINAEKYNCSGLLCEIIINEYLKYLFFDDWNVKLTVKSYKHSWKCNVEEKFLLSINHKPLARKKGKILFYNYNMISQLNVML